MISVPPFKVTGHIHLMPERNLREALTELTGDFLPVTEAAFWSDVLGEARTDGRARRREPRRCPDPGAAHVVDPWADARMAGAGAAAGRTEAVRRAHREAAVARPDVPRPRPPRANPGW